MAVQERPQAIGAIYHVTLRGARQCPIFFDDRHLLEASRYIVLNPVRAGLCERPEEYAWSSYRGLIGLERPLFRESDWLLAQFGRTRERAVENYIAFIDDALEAGASLVAKA